MTTNEGGRQLTKEQSVTFDKAEEKLSTFHADIEKLSNKKPDGVLNAFKLRFINQVLGTVNQLLGEEYRPFLDFKVFDVEGSMPSASDVVMMLSQYRNAMKKFRRDHQTTVSKDDNLLESISLSRAWNLSDANCDHD